jgi:hypothetical protein
LRLDAVNIAIIAQLAEDAIVAVEELEQQLAQASASAAVPAVGWACRRGRRS